MSDDISHSAERPTNVRWIVFGLGCGTSWLLYLHRYTFALIKPKLQDEWGLSKTELGLLDSAFQFCYSAFQFPSGVLADVAGVHLFLTATILLWSIALGLHAWAPDLPALRAARGLFGAAQAGCFAAVNRLTRTWFPFSVRTTAQGFIGVFSGRIGGLSANLLFATVLVGLLALNWRTAVYILAGAGVLHGLLFLVLFRNSPRDHPLTNPAEADLIEEIAPSERPAARLTVREMFRRMDRRSTANLLCITLASSLSTIADNIYSNWIPLFLSDVHDLNFKEMGIYSALPLAGGAFGGAFGGFLNDRMIRLTGNRRWSRSLIGMSGKGMAAVVLVAALATSYDDPYRFCGCLFLVKFCADISLASRWGTVTDIAGPATASVFAFNNSLAALIGMTAPILYGWVADRASWYAVFVIAAGVYAACALSWLLIDCTVPLLRDFEDDA